jgi:hypothetical protein
MLVNKLETQPTTSNINSGNINQPVTVDHDPSTNKEAVTLNYLNQKASQYLPKANPVMTGPLQLTYTPTDDNHIANKQYVLDANSQRTNSSQAYFNNQIQNYLPKSGGTITGDLILSGNPVNNYDLATYGYLQNKIASMTGGGTITNGVKTGTIVEVPYNYTYDNSAYLLCNGASVSKTTYSALYNIIGDQFTLSGKGGGVPWQYQWGFNPSTQNDITGWTSANSLATTVTLTTVLVTKNYIYILGGHNSSGAVNTIQRASFDSNGDLTSTWSNVGTLPQAMYGMGYVATKGRIYLIGGADGANALTTVYSAPINTDGTLGTFRTETPLPDGRYESVCFVIKNKLYVVGGRNNNIFNNGNDTNTVYQATVNNDGTLSSWTTLSNFPIIFTHGKPLLIKDMIYIFETINNTGVSKNYYTTYDSDGNIGTWNYVGNMPDNVCGSAIVCTDNYVFSIGGYSFDTNQYTNAVYRASILVNGNIDNWAQIGNVPISANHGRLAIAGNKIYYMAVRDANTIYNNVYTATFTSGITDYTPYYTDQPNTSSTFNLPNLTSRSNTYPQMKYIIKT